MVAAHYPLQALLYAVALHRYLRWRLPRLRARPAPRRRPLPLRPRHERGRADVVDGAALRRVVLAPAASAGRGAERLFDGGGVVTTLDDASTPSTPRSCSARRARCSSSTGPGSSPPPTSTSPCGWPGSATARTTRSVSAPPSRPAPRASATSASTWPRSATRRAATPTRRPTSRRCPGPTRRSGSSAWPRAPWSGDDRPLHLAGTTLYLDRLWSDERQVAHDLLERASEPAGDVDDGPASPRAWRASSTERRRPGPAAPGRRRRRPAPGVGDRRRPGHRQDHAPWPGSWRCSTSRPSAAAARPPRIALAAPTGKAAARLEEAVRPGPTTCRSTTRSRDAAARPAGGTIHRLLGFNPGNRTRFRHDRPTGCPTTSSWSTRPPWCRSR